MDWTRDAADEAATPEADVVFTLTTPDGRTWRKQWFLTRGAGTYDLRLRLSVRGRDGADTTPVPLKLLASANLLADEPSGAALGMATEAVYALASEGELAGKDHFFGFERRDVRAAGLGADAPALVGVRSQYFLVAAYAAPGLPALPADRLWATGEEGHARDAMGANLKEWFAEKTGRVAADNADHGLHRRLIQARDHMLYAWLGLTIAPGAAPVEVAFYAGPISREVLRTEAYKPMAPVITYPGAPDWLAEVLLWIYDRWRLLFGSAGLAVILLTLTVRGLLMPISIRNQLGMRRYGRKVAKLKPKVQALQKKWAGNPQRLRQEQMLLYREHGIGFPMGCLMMLLQIPIFFALFGAVRVEYTLRGAPFLWIRDLALPDRLVDLPRNFPLISSINLLPILLIGISILQTRAMPKPTDEQQAQQMRMMKWMPILFAVILYSYTAALALYMVVSSAVALLESKIVKKRDEAEQEATAVPVA
jgi:YidC/Oxa1 family membrane protein insertase